MAVLTYRCLFHFSGGTLIGTMLRQTVPPAQPCMFVWEALCTASVLLTMHCSGKTSSVTVSMSVASGPESQRGKVICNAPHRLAAPEALAMEPQSRVLLEQSYLALADAKPARGLLVDSKTGVVHVQC